MKIKELPLKYLWVDDLISETIRTEGEYAD